VPPSAKFPAGWKFIIDEKREGYGPNAGLAPPMKGAFGLKLLAPTGTEYYSVERAKGHQNTVLKEVSAKAFYEHIGASKSTPQKSTPNANRASAGISGGTPRNGRCGVCENCQKEACGNCASCSSSSRGTSRRCFQKVTLLIYTAFRFVNTNMSLKYFILYL